MRNEHRALFLGQVIQYLVDGIPDHRFEFFLLRGGSEVRKHLGERYGSVFTVAGFISVTHAHRPLFTEEVDDAVVGNRVQPGGEVLNSVKVPETQCELVKDILQYVLRLHAAGNAVPDVTEQLFMLGVVGGAYFFRLLRAHGGCFLRSETDEEEEYFKFRDFFSQKILFRKGAKNQQGKRKFHTLMGTKNPTPMKNYLFLTACLVLLTGSLPAQDMEGAKDHPLFNRMTGFTITDYSFEEFGSAEFYDENDNSVIVEGEKTYIYYESEDLVAPLKIIRNYANAARQIGGKAVEYTGNRVDINIKKDGKEIWAEVYAGDYYYTLMVVEKADVRQEISANDLLKALNSTGKAIVYINFNSGESKILEESKPIVDQILQLLKENPEIKLSIEGHTDSQGDHAANQSLSENRARAVVDAIVAGGISQERLISKGFGEDKPIADNTTEEGRAKNRRVELIKQ